MKFVAQISVMPLKEILDPQGKAVMQGLKNMGINHISDVRVGKHLTIQIDAENKQIAHNEIDMSCQKLLCNPIMEYYTFTIEVV
ncbi:MAG: phosphoribosylformylglycinamidine synthase subunit PurS [Cytophagales bacterium]|nr:phosphoribosylformylglycinamidine synthase subunit PurS [Cytophagales bacterium]